MIRSPGLQKKAQNNHSEMTAAIGGLQPLALRLVKTRARRLAEVACGNG